MKKLLVVFGTRPEAIKLSPLILAAKADERFHVTVCSTGQHREMLLPIMQFFGIQPDFDLDLMKPGQSLAELSSRVMMGIDSVLGRQSFDAIVVQGDTTTCFIAGLAAFYRKIPVVHVEAGLRSDDIFSPFPEEFNRKATGLMAALHFSPTEKAQANLLSENVPASQIFVTGNTGIDALFEVKNRLQKDQALRQELAQKFHFLNPAKKLILVTLHRRESFGAPMEEVMQGLLKLAQRDDLEILIPLHLNPEVRRSAEKILGPKARWNNALDSGSVNIWLSDPVEYVPFVYLMDRSHLIITDSGGVQEEAPSLAKPILVAREKTERPEALEAGNSKLVPLHSEGFIKLVREVLDNEDVYKKMAQSRNPFGDGKACSRILQGISEFRSDA